MEVQNFNELIKECKTIKDAIQTVFNKNYVNAQLSKAIRDLCIENGYTWEEHLEKVREEKFCLFCGKKLDMLHRDSRAKFCNASCAAKFNNHKRVITLETKSKISDKIKSICNTQETKLYRKRYSFKERLFLNGIKEYKCECCGISEWQGKTISLQIHHIDGNHHNDDLSNIQILCPNCHSQTDNFCSKNRKIGNIKQTFCCRKCGKGLTEERKSGLCFQCYNEEQIKVKSKRPSKEKLIESLQKCKSQCELSKEYNVCTTTIRKWLIHYDLYNF